MPDKYVGTIPVLAGKPWDRAAVELHEYLRKANYAHNLGVDLQAISISGGNTTGTLTALSAGTIYLSASNNLTLSQSGQSIGISGPTLMSLGVSTGGNTAGTTGMVASRVVFYGGSNVSLSQSVSGQSATITWNVHPPIGIAAGTQTATTGTVIFSNSNGVSFGLNNGTMTASVSVGGGSLSVSGSNGSFVSGAINFGLSNTNITVYTTEDGIGSAALAFSARDKYLEAGISNLGNTAGTSGVAAFQMIFVGSNNITLSQSNDGGTNATISIIGGGGAGDGYNIIAAGTQTAATTGTVVFSNSNGVNFGMSNSSVITADIPRFTLSAGASTRADSALASLVFSNSNSVSFGLESYGINQLRITGSVETSYAASNHSHGNPTLALTNLTGTTASASNGLTLSLSAGPPGTAFNTLSYYANAPNLAGPVAQTFGQSTSVIFPFVVPYILSAAYMRLPYSAGFQAVSTTAATTGNSQFSCGRWYTSNFVIYTRGAGANSNSLQYYTSTSAGMTYSYNISAAANSTQFSYTLRYTYPCSSGVIGFTKDYSSSAASLNFHSSHLTNLQGNIIMEIPFGVSLTPGQYWLAVGATSTMSTQLRPDMSRNSPLFSHWVMTQSNGAWGSLGVGTTTTVQIQPGIGSFTLGGAAGTTSSVGLGAISISGSSPQFYLQLMRVS